MNKLIRWSELVAVLCPFLAGGLMVFDLMSQKWLLFWIWVGLSISLAVVTISLNNQRIKAIRVMVEMGKQMNETRTLLDQSGDMNQRLLVDNVRAYAILAGLVGIKMSVSVNVKKVKQ